MLLAYLCHRAFLGRLRYLCSVSLRSIIYFFYPFETRNTAFNRPMGYNPKYAPIPTHTRGAHRKFFWCTLLVLKSKFWSYYVEYTLRWDSKGYVGHLGQSGHKSCWYLNSSGQLGFPDVISDYWTALPVRSIWVMRHQGDLRLAAHWIDTRWIDTRWIDKLPPSPLPHAAKKSYELNGPLQTESMQHTRTW